VEFSYRITSKSRKKRGTVTGGGTGQTTKILQTEGNFLGATKYYSSEFTETNKRQLYGVEIKGARSYE